MKVAVAADGDQVASHFGRCGHFVVATVEAGSVSTSEVLAAAPHSGTCSSPSLLARHGITHLIAGGMGPRAVDAFAELGIERLLCADGSVYGALADLAAGKLVSQPGECDHSAVPCSH